MIFTTADEFVSKSPSTSTENPFSVISPFSSFTPVKLRLVIKTEYFPVLSDLFFIIYVGSGLDVSDKSSRVTDSMLFSYINVPPPYGLNSRAHGSMRAYTAEETAHIEIDIKIEMKSFFIKILRKIYINIILHAKYLFKLYFFGIA